MIRSGGPREIKDREEGEAGFTPEMQMRFKYVYILPLIFILTLLAAILFRIHSCESRDTAETGQNRISSIENISSENIELKRDVICLGTFGTFIVIADSADAIAIMHSVDSLVGYLERETGIFSDGELSRINEEGMSVLSESSSDIRFLLEQSLWISSITDSLFDPALGAMIDLWGFPHNPRLPDSGEIDSVLQISGVSNMDISSDTIRLLQGMKLDFGAIAKGYAVDRAYNLAIELGAEGALIEIGGEIRCGSPGSTDRIWTIALRDPRSTGVLETFKTSGGSFATSGSYESSFESGGVEYSHIMNPLTGYPEEDVLSVTVFADEAYIADALATALAVGGTGLLEFIPDSLYSRIIIMTETAGDDFETFEFIGQNEKR